MTQAVGAPVCRPALAIKDIHFSEMQPPTLERRWTAVMSVDASRRAVNTGGYFEIGFSRLKENGIAVEFREQSIWLPAAAVGESFGGFLGGRSRGGLLAGQRCAVLVSRLSEHETTGRQTRRDELSSAARSNSPSNGRCRNSPSSVRDPMCGTVCRPRTRACP